MTPTPKPVRDRAGRLARHAVKKGLLVRPISCPRCGAGATLSSPIQAHHADYSKPLSVEWLCAKCHRKETPLPAVMGGKALGSINGQSKLSETDVISARRLRAKGLTFQEIGDRFGVHNTTVMRAIKSELWGQVK